MPTVYSVTADEATMARPGSTMSRTSRPASATACRTASPHSVIVGASSPST